MPEKGRERHRPDMREEDGRCVMTISIDWHTAACVLVGLIAYVLLRKKR